MPGHSAIIEMKLRTDNREFDVVQSGGDFLHLKNSETFPAGPAVFEITIDGEKTEKSMFLEAVNNHFKVYSSVPEPSAQMVAEP